MNELNIITVVAHIHPDGDVFIKGKDKKMHYIGFLETEETTQTIEHHVPNLSYKKAKKFL